MRPNQQLTENQLIEAIKQLEEQLHSGDATEEMANCLEHYRRQLRRIRDVKAGGRKWGL